MIKCLVQGMSMRPRGVEELGQSDMSTGHSLTPIGATPQSAKSGGARLFPFETKSYTLIENGRISSANEELPVRLSLHHFGGAMSNNAKVGQ